MAIDETIKRPKSMNVSSRNVNTTNNDNKSKNPTLPPRASYYLARKNRIERWAFEGRSSSISDRPSSTALGTGSEPKGAENTLSQSGRLLSINLIRLSEQRQRLIEQRNFDQKLFANKQALKHKDNISILK